MPQPFAALETRLGQTAAAMLADATLTAGALSVDGILDESRVVEHDMRGRRVQFIAPAGTDADDFEEGDAVTVTKNSVGTDYLVAMAPAIAGGQTVIDLRKAAL
jgi:hypothetical protein